MNEKSNEHLQKIINDLKRLEPILDELKQCRNIYEKISLIRSQDCVGSYLYKHSALENMLESMSPEEVLAIISLIFLGVADYLFIPCPEEKDKLFPSCFGKLLDNLLDIEKFYDTMGGIIGYHVRVLKLIIEDNKPKQSQKEIYFHTPPKFDIIEESEEVSEAILHGIKELRASTLILPVGGAGDRLSLVDEISGEPLPSACLCFGGVSLLEGIIRDLQALEYLHYKLEGKQLQIPVVMMTSWEKNNFKQMLAICEKARWFGRHRHRFLSFIQPLTPVINDLGEWAVEGPFKPVLKPGGHGVLWKLIEDKGIFDILERDHIKYAIVRQINNPLAGIDHGILCLLGRGAQQKKVFGFASCERLVKSSEGMDILVETKTKAGFTYALTNVEYTQFSKNGIQDIPKSEGSSYSCFPTNTNILFAEIKGLRKKISKCPIPGMLINMKHSFPTHDGDQRLGGRLESTMQNIADILVTQTKKRAKEVDKINLHSFMTFNERMKTISVTKKSYPGQGSIQETPEGAFYELQLAYRELFSEWCGFKIPPPQSEAEFIAEGPNLLISFHPALGPLWGVIAQKIKGGVLASSAELSLKIAEARIVNLNLNGTLLVDAKAVMGEKNSQELLTYSEFSGKIELVNVVIDNKGINRQAANNYWKQNVEHHEALKVILYGDAEFSAENMILRGAMTFTVPDGHRMIVEEKNGEVATIMEKIRSPSWWWKYCVAEDKRIVLQR